jgi:hypothetical protein
MPLNAAPAPRKRASQSRPTAALAEAHSPARLPLAVRPMPDEPAASWAVRFAARYHVSVRPLLAEVLGIRVEAWRADSFARVLEPHHDLIRDAMNIPNQTPLFEPAELTRDLTTCLDTYLTQYHPRAWRGRPTSRFCPLCLAEHDGVWRHEWAQPLAMLCRDHELLLVSGCPRCRGTPWSSSAWLASADPGWICARTHDRRTPPDKRQVATRCGLDLRTAQAMPAASTDLTTQRLIDRLVSTSGRIREAALARPELRRPTFDAVGHHFHPFDVLTALLELADAASPYRITSDPAALLDRLRESIPVLGIRDTAAAAERVISSLGVRSAYAPTLAVRDLRRRKHNPVLGYLAITTMAPTMSPTLQLTYRMASSTPRYPQSGIIWPRAHMPARREETQLPWIPQTLWTGALPDELDGTGYLDRAVSSMLFAHLGNTRSWQHIAVDLGLPAAFRVRPQARVRRLHKQRRWWDYLLALEALFDRLAAAPPPINYQRRRRTCSDPALILRATSHTLRRAATLSGEADTLVWARLFWQVYTGGDIRLAPAPLHQATRLASPAGAPLTDELEPATIQLLQHIRSLIEQALVIVDDGPLWWNPP